MSPFITRHYAESIPVVMLGLVGSTDTAPSAGGVLISGRGASMVVVALCSRSAGGRVLLLMVHSVTVGAG